MHEVSCSNPGLCKCAYFIKKLYLSSREACGGRRSAGIFIFFFILLFTSFFLFFHFFKNDLQRRVIALRIQIDFQLREVPKNIFHSSVINPLEQQDRHCSHSIKYGLILLPNHPKIRYRKHYGVKYLAAVLWYYFLL